MAQNWPTFPIPGSRFISAFRGDFNALIDALVTVFIGAVEPATKYSCMLWADTAALQLKQRNVANTAWIIRGNLEQDYGGALTRAGTAGSAMTGDVDMGGFKITNLAQGSGNAAARVADLASYSKLDGSTPYTGIPAGPAQNPSTDNQFARKKYVDDKVLAGGTYTGQIVMPIAPAPGSNQVTRKVDLENLVDNHIHNGAVGQGVGISISNLVAPSIGAYRIARASGEGAVVLSLINQKPIVFLAEVPLLFPYTAGFNNSTWFTQDLTAWITSTGPYAAILQVTVVGSEIAGQVKTSKLELRKVGATPSSPQTLSWTLEEGRSVSMVTFAEIDPTTRQFQYRPNSQNMNVYLLGYVQQTTQD